MRGIVIVNCIISFWLGAFPSHHSLAHNFACGHHICSINFCHPLCLRLIPWMPATVQRTHNLSSGSSCCTDQFFVFLQICEWKSLYGSVQLPCACSFFQPPNWSEPSLRNGSLGASDPALQILSKNTSSPSSYKVPLVLLVKCLWIRFLPSPSILLPNKFLYWKCYVLQ